MHRQIGVGDDEFRIDLEGGAEPVAGLTGAIGRVEREVSGGGLGMARPTGRAGEVLAEGQRLVLTSVSSTDQFDLRDAVGEGEG